MGHRKGGQAATGWCRWRDRGYPQSRWTEKRGGERPIGGERSGPSPEEVSAIIDCGALVASGPVAGACRAVGHAPPPRAAVAPATRGADARAPRAGGFGTPGGVPGVPRAVRVAARASAGSVPGGVLVPPAPAAATGGSSRGSAPAHWTAAVKGRRADPARPVAAPAAWPAIARGALSGAAALRETGSATTGGSPVPRNEPGRSAAFRTRAGRIAPPGSGSGTGAGASRS